MTLTDRLRRIETRLDALELAVAASAKVQDALVDAIEASAQDGADPDAQPLVTLDGETFGADRDQSQPL